MKKYIVAFIFALTAIFSANALFADENTIPPLKGVDFKIAKMQRLGEGLLITAQWLNHNEETFRPVVQQGWSLDNSTPLSARVVFDNGEVSFMVPMSLFSLNKNQKINQYFVVPKIPAGAKAIAKIIVGGDSYTLIQVTDDNTWGQFKYVISNLSLPPNDPSKFQGVKFNHPYMKLDDYKVYKDGNDLVIDTRITNNFVADVKLEVIGSEVVDSDGENYHVGCKSLPMLLKGCPTRVVFRIWNGASAESFAVVNIQMTHNHLYTAWPVNLEIRDLQVK